MGDLGGVDAVVHEEEVDVFRIVDEEGFVARGHHVFGLLIRTETNLQGNRVSVFAFSGIQPRWT